MRRWLVAMSLLAASAAPALAPYAALERPVPVGETDVLLQYDDGTGWWITWGGTYRGTWFDAEDFIPPGVGFWWAEDVELWFYHWVELYPWDTSSFYSELWNGGVGAPTTLLHQTSIQAMHCSPCCYSPEITLATQFWLVVNTEMSQGGWPSTLADNTPSALGDHSFFSDDFVLWEPFVVQGPTANDYLMRSSNFWIWPSLEAESWAGIKALF